jgi:hypothetical protein
MVDGLQARMHGPRLGIDHVKGEPGSLTPAAQKPT